MWEKIKNYLKKDEQLIKGKKMLLEEGVRKADLADYTDEFVIWVSKGRDGNFDGEIYRYKMKKEANSVKKPTRNKRKSVLRKLPIFSLIGTSLLVSNVEANTINLGQEVKAVSCGKSVAKKSENAEAVLYEKIVQLEKVGKYNPVAYDEIFNDKTLSTFNLLQLANSRHQMVIARAVMATDDKPGIVTSAIYRAISADKYIPIIWKAIIKRRNLIRPEMWELVAQSKHKEMILDVARYGNTESLDIAFERVYESKNKELILAFCDIAKKNDNASISFNLKSLVITNDKDTKDKLFGISQFDNMKFGNP